MWVPALDNCCDGRIDAGALFRRGGWKESTVEECASKRQYSGLQRRVKERARAMESSEPHEGGAGGVLAGSHPGDGPKTKDSRLSTTQVDSLITTF